VDTYFLSFVRIEFRFLFWLGPNDIKNSRRVCLRRMFTFCFNIYHNARIEIMRDDVRKLFHRSSTTLRVYLSIFPKHVTNIESKPENSLPNLHIYVRVCVCVCVIFIRRTEQFLFQIFTTKTSVL